MGTNVVVVLLLTDQEETRELFSTIQLRNLTGKFTFVGSDGVGMNLDDLDGVEDVAVGGLSVRAFAVTDLPFFEYFESLTPCSNNSNPWLKLMWKEVFLVNLLKRTRLEALFNNSQDLNAENETFINCSFAIKLIPDYARESLVSFLMDAILVFGDAISRLIKDSCTHIVHQLAEEHSSKFYLKNCIRSNGLLTYLMNTNIVANNGEVKFDTNGDIRGKYEIINFQKNKNTYSIVRVAVWHITNESIDIDDSLILWNVKHYENDSFQMLRHDIFNGIFHFIY